MSASIRLRFIDWFRSLIDKARKHVAKNLGVHQPYPVARYDTHLGAIGPVSVNGGQTQIDNTIGNPVLRDKIAKYNRSLAVDNLGVESFRQRKHIAGLNNHLIAHQKPPLGKVFNVSSVNAQTAGVQP